MSPHHPTNAGRGPSDSDALDRLLSGFFQGEMPRHWPAAPATSVEPASRTTFAGNGSASRWALAASVALLFGTCWYAARGTTTGGPTGSPTASQKTLDSRATAGNGDILNEMQKQRAVTEPAPTQP